MIEEIYQLESCEFWETIATALHDAEIDDSIDEFFEEYYDCYDGSDGDEEYYDCYDGSD